MAADRHLAWDGLYNARDLGGLRTPSGETAWRAVVRSENPERLTPAGWAALADYGVRTVIDLRNDDELGADAAARPAGITTVRVPLEDYDGAPDFWRHWRDTGLWATPLYYRAYLETFPHRAAAAVTAVAAAEPGGVLVHCAAGRDRTGLITLLLLAMAGVSVADIAADHALSTERLAPLWPVLGLPDQGPGVAELIAGQGTTADAAIGAALAGFESAGEGGGDLPGRVEACLLAGGMTATEVAAARARLGQHG
ncbi:MAG: tyrosine-protein phosphatase [Labedaea sp.]